MQDLVYTIIAVQIVLMTSCLHLGLYYVICSDCSDCVKKIFPYHLLSGRRVEETLVYYFPLPTMELLPLHSFLLFLLPLATLVSGHGNMVKPLAIWDEQQHGWCWDEDGNHDVGCGNLDLPHTEFEDVKGKKPDCFQYWFSDWGSSFGIEGEPPCPRSCDSPRSPASTR